MTSIRTLSFLYACVLLATLVACSSDSSSPTNQPPIASAGPDQSVLLGIAVTLDGSGSSDPESQPLSYSWSFLQRPAGSTASLSSATAEKPTFTPDLTGTYRAQLIVSDGSLDSSPDVVDIDVAANASPTADAGPDQDVNISATVTLDGSGSSDPESQPLTYKWTQVAGYGPDVTGGMGVLTGVSPSFTAPTRPSTIVFDLRVNDGAGDSFADRVQVNVFRNSARTIFVRPDSGGNDSFPGTRAQPKQTLTAAIAAAGATIPVSDVYLAADEGTFDSTSTTIALTNGVSLYGGYSVADNWTRPTGLRSTINGAVTGISAASLTTETDLEQIELLSANASSAGESSYGVFAVSSPGLVIRDSRIVAGQGANGSNATSPTGTGTSGSNGNPGQAGCENSTLLCGTCTQPQGGLGGTGYAGRNGGNGGLPGLGANSGSFGLSGYGGTAGGPGTPGGNGDWDTPSTYWGQNGTAGAVGTNGAAGQPNYTNTGYAPLAGQTGVLGSAGYGGGGGGGGGGGTTACDSYGGAGGGGGGGGGPGTGAPGGSSGGGSFAIYLWGSNATIDSSDLVTSNGGTGGTGGTGQPGGTGGQGGRSSNPATPGAGNNYGGSGEQDDGSNGGRGGDGGNGGQGGHGGGGAGGPSIGIVQGGGSTPTLSSLSYTLGSAGTGGSSSGNAGANGQQANTYTP